jgi:hypothetical protein
MLQFQRFDRLAFEPKVGLFRRRQDDRIAFG